MAIQIVAPPADKSPLSRQPQWTGTYAVIRGDFFRVCRFLEYRDHTPAQSSGHTFVFGVSVFMTEQSQGETP
jgi:hypothetical protein